MFNKFKLMPIKGIFIEIVSGADRVFCFKINGSVCPTEGLQTLRFLRFSTLIKLSSSSLRRFYSSTGVHLSFV